MSNSMQYHYDKQEEAFAEKEKERQAHTVVVTVGELEEWRNTLREFLSKHEYLKRGWHEKTDNLLVSIRDVIKRSEGT